MSCRLASSVGAISCSRSVGTVADGDALAERSRQQVIRPAFIGCGREILSVQAANALLCSVHRVFENPKIFCD